MAMNYALKGKVYEPVEFTVERDRVLEFDRAIGESHPVFVDPAAAKEAGFDDQLAPPTFPTVMQIMTSGQVVVDQELGLDYMMVVHAGQEYDYRRPLRVGDRLTATPRIADVYARGPHEYLVIEAEITDASGETVVVARSTLLSRGTARS
jgi:acyl dehydratase